MSAYIKHCLSKGKYDNEVALACSLNALFFYSLCRYKKCEQIHDTLYKNKVKGKGVCKTKTVFYRTYEPVA